MVKNTKGQPRNGCKSRSNFFNNSNSDEFGADFYSKGGKGNKNLLESFVLDNHLYFTTACDHSLVVFV